MLNVVFVFFHILLFFSSQAFSQMISDITAFKLHLNPSQTNVFIRIYKNIRVHLFLFDTVNIVIL